MKNNILKSFASLIAALFFIMIAVSYESTTSFDKLESKYLGDGIYEESLFHIIGVREITVGKKDEYGLWQGEVKITTESTFYEGITTETVNFVDGKRHGKAHVIFRDEREGYFCYNMDVLIPCPDDDGNRTADIMNRKSAYEILNEKYPWLFDFYLSDSIEQSGQFEFFMDIVEASLDSLTIQPENFDEQYNAALNNLDKDSINDVINYYFSLRFVVGIENYKNFEFRRAMLERYYTAEPRSFTIVKKTYPNMISTMNSFAIPENDFAKFCDDFDTKMDEKLNISIDDPMFIDSLDKWMFQVLSGKFDDDDDDDAGRRFVNLLNRINLLKTTSINSPGDIRNIMGSDLVVQDTILNAAQVMLYLVFQKIYEGDVVKASIRDAYFSNREIPLTATVTTELKSNTSEGIAIKGYVLNSGGAEIMERGVVWDTIFQPTVENNKLNRGYGVGEFDILIGNLVSDKRYFFRTYAINSAGISYGNVVEAITEKISSVQNLNGQHLEVLLFPNPSDGRFTLNVKEVLSKVQIKVYNTAGNLVFNRFYDNTDQIQEHLENVLPGVYLMVVTTNQGNTVKKFTVAY